MPSRTATLEAPGPFRASQLRDGDPYELSNGHPIRCMGAGDRHGVGNTQGAKVLDTDPGGELAGVDVGHAFGNDDEFLRAPDISVGNLQAEPGWAAGPPPLAVEYADRGQDEKQLGLKIAELLAAGTKYVWVVRLTGPLRVEVHQPGKRVRVVGADEELTAPGILKNAVPVRALVDREAANQAVLRNLLNQEGYADLDAVRAEGQAEGLREAVFALCEVLNLTVSDRRRGQLSRMGLQDLQGLLAHLRRHRAWPR